MIYEKDSLPLPMGRPRRKRLRRRRLLLTLFLFLIVVVGGFFLFFRDTGDEKVPLIAEAPEPPIVASEEIKSPPEEPGGLEIAHQDKLIYERLTPADVTVSDEDGLNEVMMGLVAEDPLANFSASDSDGEPAKLAISPDAGGESIEPSAAPAAAPAAEDSPEPATPSDSAGESVEPSIASIESEESEPEESAPEQEVEPAPEPSATPLPESNYSSDSVDSGDYVVQLAAFSRNADAEAVLAQIASKFSDIVGSSALFVQEADLDDRGIWHRLRVGYFVERGEAVEVCVQFQLRGQDCLVTTR
ncbi:MAG: SPOR domain-containing protein [Hyphomicrobiales bacterium]|nr:SPOR domain-containing protein [Hyphomicrobiales bacterium]